MEETTIPAYPKASIDLNRNPLFTPDTLQQVLNHLPVAVMITNDKANIIYYNNAFGKLFDVQSYTEKIFGLNWQVFADKMYASFLFSSEYKINIDQILKDKKPLTQKLKLYDGRLIAIEYAPCHVENNSLHQFTFTDVTAHTNASQQVVDQRNLYESILNNLPSDIAVLSNDFSYLFLNPAAVKNIETRQSLIGKNDFDNCTYHVNDLSVAVNKKDIYQKALTNKTTVEWEEEIVNFNGATEYYLRQLKPVFNTKGEIDILIRYGLNISERKNIENRIQISEKRYRDLFNYSQAIICTHNLEGTLLTVNPALCETLGYDVNHIIGKNLQEFLPVEDLGNFEQNYLSSIINQPKAKGVFRVKAKDNSLIYLLYENFKVEEPMAATYVIGFAHNVTERINAENELREAKKLTERTALLKERFLANMSHEIRTPMNGILGMSNLLQKTTLNQDQQQYLKIISDSAQNLLTIINDILDIEKIAAGEVNIESIPFDIVEKTNSALNLFKYACNEKGLALNFKNDFGAALHIMGDPTRYNQILNNLISNSIKFTNTGSINLRGSIERVEEDTLTLQVDIIDSGIGMEDNKLTRIFEPFTQAYSETTRKYGGTGLGLAITKNLVELQGGTIGVKSKLGYGSKFTFTIKYKKCADADAVKKEPKQPKPVLNRLGAIKVLLAEDNEVNQLLARSILTYWGLETRTAVTGNEVISLVNNEDFDVILMDIQMPEKSGLEAALEIRKLADKKKSNIPIIALTANALKGEEKKYVAVGMDDFLTKPFKEKELYDVIARVLDNKGSFGREMNSIAENKLTTTKVVPLEKTDYERLYDMNSLNEVSRGNKDFLVSLARIFLNTIPKNSNEMVEAADIKNWDKVSALAHKLKSTIDTMNIKSIKQDIRAIEINAKNKADLVSVCKQVQKVNSIIEKTALQLKEQFSL